MIVVCYPHPEKKNLLVIAIDEEPICELSTTIFGKNPVLPKKVESFEALNEQVLELEFQGAKRYLLSKLSQRSYHSAEVDNLLAKKMVSKDTIIRLLAECCRNGYIDDQEWIEQFIRTQHHKKRGPQWIEEKLRQKRIPLEEARFFLEESNSNDELQEQIIHLLQTRYRTRNLNDFREREKTIGSLARRGYDPYLVREILKKNLWMKQ